MQHKYCNYTKFSLYNALFATKVKMGDTAYHLTQSYRPSLLVCFMWLLGFVYSKVLSPIISMFSMEKEFHSAKVALDNLEKLERNMDVIKRKIAAMDRKREPMSVVKMKLDAAFNNCSKKAIC